MAVVNEQPRPFIIIKLVLNLLVFMKRYVTLRRKKNYDSSYLPTNDECIARVKHQSRVHKQ